MLDENAPGTVVDNGEGSPKRRGRGPNKPKVSADSQLSSGELLEVMFKKFSELNNQTQENFMLAIAEMKKPSVREQMQIDKEEELVRKKQLGRIEAAQQEIARDQAKRDGCSHTMPSTIAGLPGRHAWVAAVNSDGYVRPFCNVCRFGDKGQLKFKATPHMLQNGVGMNTMTNINLETLTKWAAQHA